MDEVKKKAKWYLVQVIKRDYTEKFLRVALDEDTLNQTQNDLLDRLDARQVYIYEQVFSHHKSYAEDYEPARLLEFIDSLGENLHISDDLKNAKSESIEEFDARMGPPVDVSTVFPDFPGAVHVA
jgi:hypothetical protein